MPSVPTADPHTVAQRTSSDAAVADQVVTPLDAPAPAPDLVSVCVIDGVACAAGTRDKGNECDACVPSISTTTWTNVNATGVPCNGFCVDPVDFDYSITDCGEFGHACNPCNTSWRGMCLPLDGCLTTDD